MNRFKKILLPLIILAIMATPVFVWAEGDFGLGDAAQGTDLIGSNTIVNPDQAVPRLIGRVVAVILSFVGAIFFLAILYAGITWMTAFGNSEKVDKAKSIVEHAAIGLVIVLAAYAISTFVFNKITAIGSSESSTTAIQSPIS